MSRSADVLLCSLLLGGFLLGFGGSDAQAQSRRGRQAPAYRQSAPSQNARRAPARSGQTGPSAPAGTQLPSYAEPAPPPTYGPSPGGRRPDGAHAPGRARTNAPGTPTAPAQAPIGGAEWLAAAGAAYALNRLRDEETADEEGEEG